LAHPELRRLITRAFLVAVALSCAPAAEAHDQIGNLSPFWMGMLHLYFTPLALAAVAGLMTAISAAKSRIIFSSLFLTAATTFVTALWLPATFRRWEPLGVAVAGLIAASGRTPPLWAALPLGLMIGVTIATAAELDLIGWESSLGLAAGVVVTCGLLARGIEYAQSQPRMLAVLPIASRVIGAWAAAIALLLGALTIKEGF
jgi:hypothetical protein